MTTTTPTVLCGNEDHDEETPAVARLTYPNARFRPVAVCADDLEDVAEQALGEGASVLIEPIEHGHTPITRAMKAAARIHLRERGQPVRAILLEAPDMPGYDELPDTLEERRALPARFHIPRWTETGRPALWVCAVCWEDGVVYQWPCKTACAQGGEVFAR
ncbi:hypothetical protein [Spongiactinospora sp. TRM90649]|uniref:hypothetical protein n=1 Tax=Spongiactinospora sp. TRM90649 TaxID=3031114 RepID=UPI0023F81787|nr:hypothetical protein [Spongiactinospora sp. TRM90649]MDF5758574.1 hypothetical protein [Spongiactinospora sp. TRM90649]